MSPITYTTRTEGHMKINSIIWEVPKFVDILEYETTIDLQSEMSVNSIRLAMKFLGLSESRKVAIFYFPDESLFFKPKIKFRFIFTITLCCEQEETIIEEESRILHTQANQWHLLATLYKINLAVLNEWKNFVRTKGTLVLKLQYMDTNNIRVDHSNVPVAQLTNDFEKLLTNGLFTDVVMKSAEGVEFKVHKAVLASRCAVLRAHFEYDTKECLTNTLESPFESDVLREVLTFIYSNKAPNVDDNPKRLLAAANYYQLSRLKSLCEEALHRELTVENAIETLQLADLHSANTLKQLTLQFIRIQSKSIMKTEGWAKLKSPELIKRICECITTGEIVADTNVTETDYYLMQH